MSGVSPAISKPRELGPLLDDGAWSSYQKFVLFLTALAVILDGFDNQVLGFAIPAIVKEWGVDRSAFAPIFALGFLGMSLGTALGGVLGDRIGRKASLILSVLVFGAATGATAFTHDVFWLGACRVIAGFGLGGAMPNATTLIAEFSPLKRRSLAVTLGIVCIPLGGVIGGLIAARLLPTVGWRALFLIGGAAPLLLAAVLFFILPESPKYLAGRASRSRELGKVMGRLGHDPNAAYADTHDEVARASISALFAPGLRRETLSLWVAFFFCLLSTYIVFSWAPSLLAGAGFGLAASSNGLTMFNVGGVVGAIAGAWAILRFGSRVSMLVMAAGSVVSCAVLAALPLDPMRDATGLIVAMTIAGAFINAVQTTLYALAAQVYPREVRATGVGATAAVGRLGAIVSSFVGAAVVAAGGAAYFGVIAITMAIAGLGLAAMQRHVPRVLER